MYRYDTHDRQLVHARVEEFRQQTSRYLKGELDEDQFKPLRLMNGLYEQRLAPVLRVAIPYGVASSAQLTALADIADTYDRGYGISPNLGPVAQWGLAVERRQLVVDTETFQTNLPGVHAVGDINTYPGKKKLILSGFHEAALTAFAIKARLHPDEKVRLQYTTTSKRLHQKLGLKDSV